jgi:hypothetical protein
VPAISSIIFQNSLIPSLTRFKSNSLADMICGSWQHQCTWWVLPLLTLLLSCKILMQKGHLRYCSLIWPFWFINFGAVFPWLFNISSTSATEKFLYTWFMYMLLVWEAATAVSEPHFCWSSNTNQIATDGGVW